MDETGLQLGYVMPNEKMSLSEKNRSLERGQIGELMLHGDKVGGISSFHISINREFCILHISHSNKNDYY